jgi:hypothetical protein
LDKILLGDFKVLLGDFRVRVGGLICQERCHKNFALNVTVYQFGLGSRQVKK